MIQQGENKVADETQLGSEGKNVIRVACSHTKYPGCGSRTILWHRESGRVIDSHITQTNCYRLSNDERPNDADSQIQKEYELDATKFDEAYDAGCKITELRKRISDLEEEIDQLKQVQIPIVENYLCVPIWEEAMKRRESQ